MSGKKSRDKGIVTEKYVQKQLRPYGFTLVRQETPCYWTKYGLRYKGKQNGDLLGGFRPNGTQWSISSILEVKGIEEDLLKYSPSGDGIKPHQMKLMIEMENQGWFSYFAWVKSWRIYLLKPSEVLAKLKETKRKSIMIEWANENNYLDKGFN